MIPGINRRVVLMVAALGASVGPVLIAQLASAATLTPTISVNPSSGHPGLPVTITGSGYPPDEFVALYIDQPSLYIGTPGPRADAQGAFKFQYVWPDQTYDAGRKVNPASPGAHTVCGDTNYGGVTQQFPGKACTQFIVEGTPASPSTNSPAAVPANASGLGPIEVIGGIAILLALAIGATLLIRRSGS